MIDSYKTLTLEKYEELMKIDIEQEEVDIQANMISILSSIPLNDVYELPLTKYMELAAKTKFLTTPPTPTDIKKTYKLNGNEYVVLKSVKDMITAQYIDYQNYLQQKADLAYILSCFLIPKNNKYGEYDIDSIIEDIRQISVEEALSISNFFTKQFLSLTRATLYCLEKQMKKQMKQMDETQKPKMEIAIHNLHTLRYSLRNGDGFHQLMK